MIARIISGGQTGVDRAALDVAETHNFPRGGWCPRNRRAEDGPINPAYPLTETEESRYDVRTRRNIEESDGTLVIHREPITGGTRLTVKLASQLSRPCLCVRITSDDPGQTASYVQTILDWISQFEIKTLNVAGPRESTSPGIYRNAWQLLDQLLTAMAGDASTTNIDDCRRESQRKTAR